MLEDYQSDMLGCSRCSLCKWIPLNQIKSWRFSNVCPAITRYNFHAYSGSGKMIMGLSLLDGRMDWTEEAVKVLYRCTLCGACDVSCKVYRDDIDLVDTLEELRRRSVDDGVGPLPSHLEFKKSIETKYNPYKEPHTNRWEWMPKSITTSKKSDTAYFVGCTSAYRLPQIAQDTVKILNATKTDFMILGSDEWCCGSPLMRTGQFDLAKKMMEHNIDKLNKLGVETVITSCAGCYDMLKVDYKRYSETEMKFNVLHSVEYINQLIKEGVIEFRKETPLKVTYHDPCHLGRRVDPYAGEWEGDKLQRPEQYIRRGRNGVYDPPREVLRSIPGLELVEMERIREYAWCCGSGGGVKSAFPDFALWAANERIEEAETTGANILITCCPFCVRNLSDAAKEYKHDMEVMDLVNLVYSAMEVRK